MTKDEAVNLLLGMRNERDNESVHLNADEILMAYLQDNGGGEVARAYDALQQSVQFFYA